jgi:hypothetical protein
MNQGIVLVCLRERFHDQGIIHIEASKINSLELRIYTVAVVR